MDKLREAQSAVSKVVSNLPSVQEMKGMSDDKFAKLLERVNYPDAFKSLVPDSVTVPTREAMIAANREEAVASFMLLKDNVAQRLQFFATTTESAISGGSTDTGASERRATLAALPSPESLASLSQEEIVRALTGADYPVSFYNVLPEGIKLLELSALRTLPVADLRVVVEAMRERIAKSN